MSLNRLNTKSANVLENPLKKIYYYEITKLIGMLRSNQLCQFICCHDECTWYPWGRCEMSFAKDVDINN
jgi:hypothetical protein